MDALGVLGAGTMGAGICEAAALAGLRVTCAEPSSAQQSRARQRIAGSLEKGIARGKIVGTTAAEVLERITFCDALAGLAELPLIVEAIPEQESLKREAFSQLGRLCPSETILASNTSSLSITLLGAMSGRADRVIGMHFFNPVPIMPGVEIVLGLETSTDTQAKTEALAVRLGKTPLVVKDSPGFVSNRVLMPLINEAIFTLSEGVATAEVIDQMFKLGCRHPQGPLELADLIGLDVVLWILEVLHTQLGDPKFRPAPLLRTMVAAGRLGRKSGRGFYPYPEAKS